MSLDPSNEITEDAAIASIAGLLDLGDAPAPKRKAAPEPQEDSEDDADRVDASEPDEAPDDSGQPEDEGQDDPDVPVIDDAPESWKAEYRARFNEIPEDLRSYIVERDRETKSAVNRQITHLSEQRKAVEHQVAQSQQAQQSQQQALKQLLVLTLPELHQLQQVDWDTLSRTDQARYVELQHQQKQVHTRIQIAERQLQQFQQQQQQQQQADLHAAIMDNHQRLVEKLPEARDPEKASALHAQIVDTMREYGFRPEEINNVFDARMVEVMAEFVRFKAAQKAQKTMQSKRSAQPAPKLMGASAAPVRDRTDNQKVKDKMDTLFQSNRPGKNNRLSARQQSDLAVSLIANMI